MNLLKETKYASAETGFETSDIIFIGSEESGHQCTWDHFCVLADREQDNGFCAQEVATDLIIVFRDGSRLYRSEYDGAEGWVYSAKFKVPETSLPITSLFHPESRVGWCDLEECNSSDEDE